MAKTKIVSLRLRERELTLVNKELSDQVQWLQTQNEELFKQVHQTQADLSLQKDHMFGLYDLMDKRPRDRRLAQVMCDWMNTHDKGDWSLCPCALCLETKKHMNTLKDPIIHTSNKGWVCSEGNLKEDRRNIAAEFVDNRVVLGPASPIETQGE